MGGGRQIIQTEKFFAMEGEYPFGGNDPPNSIWPLPLLIITFSSLVHDPKQGSHYWNDSDPAIQRQRFQSLALPVLVGGLGDRVGIGSVPVLKRSKLKRHQQASLVNDTQNRSNLPVIAVALINEHADKMTKMTVDDVDAIFFNKRMKEKISRKSFTEKCN